MTATADTTATFSLGPEFDELAEQVSNWGRWGNDDQIGTINLITADAVRRGIAAVKDGRSSSLALPLSEFEGIQTGVIPGRVNPLRTMNQLAMAMFEVWPCLPADATLPVHVLHLTHMGMTQGQNWNLEELSADCADDGRYEFLLEASPQPFTGAVGSPVNPVVTK